MASALSSSAATSLLQKLPFKCHHPSPKPVLLPKHPTGRCPTRCNAFFGNAPEDLLKNTLHLDESEALFPILRSGVLQFQRITAELPVLERWEAVVFVGLCWVYLTARPGVLMGAIDAYVLAPLQIGLDSLLGRRSLKRTDFVVGKRLGEGSFGVVYAGAILPRNVTAEEAVGRGKAKSLEMDERFKEKVILKKVCMHDSTRGKYYLRGAAM